MTDADVTVIELPADNAEAVQWLRAELRAAKRRRAEDRRDAMFDAYRTLPFGGVNANSR
ncbi:hypothetical protein [Rathayibacter soli]|uniref:hypothetical protein n=1 Tax=Rathayibacter soli TaxID=3144168 RepID=UPI0027E3DE6C|nr:hypothetical protein [Glaciibacter superstes]